jgi:hypothetical protein
MASRLRRRRRAHDVDLLEILHGCGTWRFLSLYLFDADKTACVHFEGEHGGTLWRGKSVFSTSQFGAPRDSMSSC